MFQLRNWRLARSHRCDLFTEMKFNVRLDVKLIDSQMQTATIRNDKLETLMSL